MHADAQLTTLGRARLSFADEAEIDEFVRDARAATSAASSAPTSGAPSASCAAPTASARPATCRCCGSRSPRASSTAPQLDALADVAERWSRGFGHITTRQNVQFHFVKLHDVEKAMRRLAEAGLTTREACGNSVRNITACPYAGRRRTTRPST